MRAKELKEAVEKLSENDIDRLKNMKKVAQIVEEADTSEINELPVMYRMEIKKALERLGKDNMASKLKV
ncbi:MAG: hypothetical protein SVU32_00265 [Candidatus Nanohaloarchaea archaeon]|nr:hypothetical protein [Candidatus Nanohaloarchaea archaeon]